MSQALTDERERRELQARLDKINHTKAGATVLNLKACLENGKLLIRGKVQYVNALPDRPFLADNIHWLPTGRHRLKPELDLPL